MLVCFFSDGKSVDRVLVQYRYTLATLDLKIARNVSISNYIRVPVKGRYLLASIGLRRLQS